jgi:LysR family transcriptional activator of nhaA
MPKAESERTLRRTCDTKASIPASRRLLDDLQELNFSHLLYFWTVARDGSIAGACERLQLSQPTVSMQVRKLESMLGHHLFDRSGRNLVLTEIGRTVYDYADDLFAIGREMLGALRGIPGKHSGRLQVGIPTFLPKLITYRLLEPVLKMPDQVQLVCHEAPLEELIGGLAKHKFDAILSDRQIPAAGAARCFNHPLGECDIALCGSADLARHCRNGFPDSLADAPFLLPTTTSEIRRALDRWFDDVPWSPRIVAEFDDHALMKEFGGGGAGVFPVPGAVVTEVIRQYGVELLGRLPQVRARYFAVTTERKLTHPAIKLIAETARLGVLS